VENETLRFWADISTVYLLTIVFIFGLIPAVIAYFAVRGMMVVNRKVQPYMKLASYYTGIARSQVDKYTNKAVEPLARGHAEAARVGGVLRGLRSTTHGFDPMQEEKKQ
jgi:hypothetical protein